MKVSMIGTLFLIFSSGCSLEQKMSKNDESACADFVKSLNQTSAEKLFIKNKAKADLKFLAVRGFSIEFPGLDKFSYEKIQELTKQNGYITITGTSDHILDDGCSDYQNMAREYAKKYNILMIEELNHGDVN
jgi:hypothetical protein